MLGINIVFNCLAKMNIPTFAKMSVLESSIEKFTLPDFDSLFTFFVKDCLLKHTFLFIHPRTARTYFSADFVILKASLAIKMKI